MKEGFNPDASITEYEKKRREYLLISEKTKNEIFFEFDPKVAELNDQIVSCLSEQEIGKDAQLKVFSEEGRNLISQFYEKVESVGKDIDQKFEGYGFLEFELGWRDLTSYRNKQREKRHGKDIHAIKNIIKGKPPTQKLKDMIERVNIEVLPWKQLEESIEQKLGKDFVGSAIWDAIKEEIREIETRKGLNLLEDALESAKDERGEYTLDDLEQAKKELEDAKEIGMSGSNPNAGRARKQAARARLRTIERALKQTGKLEKTPEEKLTEALDKLYPNAKSKTVVTYEGKKYQIRYFPLETSRTGKTVFGWGHQWIPFSE